MKRSLLSCCLLALALLTAHPALAADMANTLVYAGENEDTINPVLSPHQELPTIIFSGLMKFDAKGLPVPDLAKSVDYDPKTLTYTFHLRDGVKWHDGAPFSAKDVVYTYTALTSDKTLTSTITSNYQDISHISAPDEHTVIIRLARVNAAMLDNFCMGILPAHLYEGHDINTVPANHAPVGTGRFKFVSWDTAGA
ncbi:ABC transporter substrate-binding protein [Desulfovibrio sp.]|uniref:ABC transporter substrate-binding protein n=1 Tax=Desulfovibrio sp. TaxID=885 RepID=UPI00257C7B5C|nr:ABC transporter substrate-binding protein [Desulfovibrio sp.]